MTSNYHADIVGGAVLSVGQPVYIPGKSEGELKMMAYFVAIGKIKAHFAPRRVKVDMHIGAHQCKVKVGRKWLGWISVQDVLDDKWEFQPL